MDIVSSAGIFGPVAGNPQDSELLFFRGRGDGTFEDRQVIDPNILTTTAFTAPLTSPMDVLMGDIDGDGVLNDTDQCQFTPIGTLVDPTNGCSIKQLSPCNGPRGTTTSWKNHGKYVSSVAKSANSFLEQGLITEEEKDAIMSNASIFELRSKVTVILVNFKIIKAFLCQ